jgi:hypothetical protein
MGAVERKHCYGGLSRVVWVDPAPANPGANYFRCVFDGPHRATFVFNFDGILRDGRRDLAERIVDWVNAFGLNANLMLDKEPITFDTAAGTITTRYVVLDPDTDVVDTTGLGVAKRDAAGRPVTEEHTVDYVGTMPAMPDFLDRAGTGEGPTA